MDYPKYVEQWHRSNQQGDPLRCDPLRCDPLRCDPLESKLNMYERQIDQLFDFIYKNQDDIKVVMKMHDDMYRLLDVIRKQHGDVSITELHNCIKNYYHLELENKGRMATIECYQFILFIVQLSIIVYLLYLNFIYT
jgi:hypothetical protein